MADSCKSCLEANISLPEIYFETGQPFDKPPAQVTDLSGESKKLSNSSLDSQMPLPIHETEASHTDAAEKDGAALCSLQDDGEILLELTEVDYYDSDTEVAGDSVSEGSEIVPDQLTVIYNSEHTPPFLIYKSVRVDTSSHIKEPSNEHNSAYCILRKMRKLHIGCTRYAQGNFMSMI